jgi:hypothetical protein
MKLEMLYASILFKGIIEPQTSVGKTGVNWLEG